VFQTYETIIVFHCQKSYVSYNYRSKKSESKHFLFVGSQDTIDRYEEDKIAFFCKLIKLHIYDRFLGHGLAHTRVIYVYYLDLWIRTRNVNEERS
jgi:hypothetical protein